MPAALVPRASSGERERLLERFVELCEIESPSQHERAMADAVAGRLRAAGLEVEEDGSRTETGSDCGNLLARVPGPEGARTILLCAHLDTVPLDAPIEVAREGGYFQNRNEGILGADNKAAVAAFLVLAERLAAEGAPVGVELLFTTCEERALAGAQALERDLLHAEYGFVLDHASPAGELVVAAPTYNRLEASFRGQAAHAGIRPEEGRSAIAAATAAIGALRLGRLDAETTANVGRIEGGTAANVVAERCRVELEARSVDHDRATALASEMIDTITEAASDADCDVETTVDELFRGYRLPRSSPPLVVASAALEDLGIEPRPIATGGGSDANVFNRLGLPCVNVANATERNHEPGERVSTEALATMLDVTFGLVGRSA